MEAFNDYSQRFIDAIDALGVRDVDVCNRLGIAKANLSVVRNGKTGVSMLVLTRFLEAFPEVDGNYIMSGYGKPFTSEEMNIKVQNARGQSTINNGRDNVGSSNSEALLAQRDLLITMRNSRDARIKELTEKLIKI